MKYAPFHVSLIGMLALFSDYNLYGDSTAGFLPGEKVKSGQIPSGYNQDAAYLSKNKWGVAISADYLYWKWQNSVMGIATLMNPTQGGASGFLNGSGEVVLQNPGYASGFQVGLGMTMRGMDSWSLMSEYTWYRNTDTLTTRAGENQYLAISPVILQFLRQANTGILLADQLDTEVKLSFDNLDVLLGRPFYLGQKLISNLKMGLKGLWITQSSTGTGQYLRFIGSNANVPISIPGSVLGTSEMKSWALGPKLGLDLSWLLGYGIKLLGKGGISGLYTSYTTLTSTVEGQVSDIDRAHLTYNQPNDYDSINMVTETSLGLGWGTYLANSRYHLDLEAYYDFNIYWNQNLMDVLIDGSGSPGNLTLQGLNVKVRFDF